MKKLLIAGLVIALIIGGLYFINAQRGNPAMDEEALSAQPPVSGMTSSPSSDRPVKTVDMEAGSFYYKPNTLTVSKGQPVKIIFRSVSMVHNFNIDELGVHSENVKSGNTATFEFTPNKAGVFQYYCSIGQHRSLGQVGTITVQ